MKEELLARRMPPWPAAEGVGRFVHDRSLSASELDSIVDWTDSGAPEGEPGALGVGAIEPPLSVTLPLPLRRGGLVQRVVLDPKLRQDRELVAWALDPGDGAFVASARIRSGARELIVYSAAEPRVDLPPGAGLRVRRGEKLTVELRFRVPPPRAPRGAALRVAWATQPVGAIRRLRTACEAVELPSAVRLVSIEPALPDGGSVRIVAQRPDASLEPLLWVRGTTPLSPLVYREAAPIVLPSGTRLRVDGGGPGCAIVYEVLDGER